MLLPPDLGAIASGWQYYCVDRFQTKKALNSPPHITLRSPFKLPVEDIDFLENCLQTFGQNQINFPIQLTGFNCFAPRVIYIDVQLTSPLRECQAQLTTALRTRLNIQAQRDGDRPFCPHVTIAFKDLSRANFDRAWAFFQARPLSHHFIAGGLSLLQHNGRHWQVRANFPLRHPA
ncbi:2'-5' RNA ligase family protein [Synechococcus moorigangaii CMS01]|nr:2'-5' RNA ligase family protein [Synechococcus moorigangaii CMS01]